MLYRAFHSSDCTSRLLAKKKGSVLCRKLNLRLSDICASDQRHFKSNPSSDFCQKVKLQNFFVSFVDIFITRLGTVRSDRVRHAVVQKDVARGERLREKFRQFGYEGKHWKRLAHYQDELLGSDIVENAIQGRERSATDQKRQTIFKEELNKVIEIEKFRIGSVGKGCLPVLLMNREFAVPAH